MEEIKIEESKINLSPEAFEQIKLFLEHDYTLEGHYFRVKIDGKGCEGFTYATGFSRPEAGDVLRIFSHPKKPEEKLKILFDSFTAQYLQEGWIEYIFHPVSGEEGFTVTNKQEKNYHGKFFKDTHPL